MLYVGHPMSKVLLVKSKLFFLMSAVLPIAFSKPQKSFVLYRSDITSKSKTRRCSSDTNSLIYTNFTTTMDF